MPAAAPPFHILSLDGGGTWSLIQVMALKALYGDARGHEVLAQFDLVVANSGGSLVLAALAENYSLSEMERLFLKESRRRSIFRPLSWWRKYLTPSAVARLFGIGPRYRTRHKLTGLAGLLPRTGKLLLTRLPEAVRLNPARTTQFVVVAYNYQYARASFLRSHPHSPASSFSPHEKLTLAEAVHASTNAPINYFDGPAEVRGEMLWDGSIAGYNNPVLVGIVEALALGHAPGTIAVLSLGTGSVRLVESPEARPPFTRERRRPSLRSDLQHLATAVLDDPPDAANRIAHVVLGQRLPATAEDRVRDGRLVRLSPLIEPVFFDDDWHPPDGLREEEFRHLLRLELDALAQHEIGLIRKLGELWIDGRVRNQPIRARHDFTCEIGHDRFADACAAWQKLAPVELVPLDSPAGSRRRPGGAPARPRPPDPHAGEQKGGEQ